MSDSGNASPPTAAAMTMRDTRIWLRLGGCAIALFFFITFIVSPYRRWQTKPAIRLLLLAIAATAPTLFTQIMGMLQSYDDMSQLYLVWIVFLNVANESAVAATAYSIYAPRSTRVAFEFGLLTNNVYLAVIMALFPVKARFHGPLWALWFFTVVKMFLRVIGFQSASRTYGPENVDLVAHLMAREPEDNSTGNPSVEKKDYYNYWIRGEHNLRYEYDGSETGPSPKLKIAKQEHDEKVVTIDKVWNCEGRLLNNNGRVATRLKDLCLSFALFKLLRRRFREYPAEDDLRGTSKRLVLEELLAKDEKKDNSVLADQDFLLRHCRRTFRLIRVELEFLHDLFFTKYPINFYGGISFLHILQMLVIASSIWTTKWALQQYDAASGRTPTWTKNAADHALTYAFTILIIFMELWELTNHMLSNWSKVLATCNYVRHHLTRDRFYGDKLLAVLGWCGTLWKPLGSSMGQYSLFQACQSSWMTISPAKTASVTKDVQFAIFQTLRDNDCCISNGIETLKRHRVDGEDQQLSSACNDKSFERKILVWHVATSFFEMEMAAERPNSRSKDSQVAIRLSRYCAYLLRYAPDLLPVHNNLVAKVMFDDVLSAARKFFHGDVKGTKKMYEKLKNAVPDKAVEGPIMATGLDLAKQLKSTVKDEEARWKLLAEFWAEFLLYLAPSDNPNAHLKRLSDGGEFITHLWALLYNAGILERPDSAV